MEEIGKLIHELFDDQKMKIEELTTHCYYSDTENRKMIMTLDKVTDIIKSLVTKSSTGEWYMQSLWGKDFEELINLLGIEKKEEEE